MRFQLPFKNVKMDDLFTLNSFVPDESSGFYFGLKFTANELPGTPQAVWGQDLGAILLEKRGDMVITHLIANGPEVYEMASFMKKRFSKKLRKSFWLYLKVIGYILAQEKERDLLEPIQGYYVFDESGLQYAKREALRRYRRTRSIATLQRGLNLKHRFMDQLNDGICRREVQQRSSRMTGFCSCNNCRRRDRAARQHDEAARQHDEAARQRDEAARQRDEAARQRDEAARQRVAENTIVMSDGEDDDVPEVEVDADLEQQAAVAEADAARVAASAVLIDNVVNEAQELLEQVDTDVAEIDTTMTQVGQEIDNVDIVMQNAERAISKMREVFMQTLDNSRAQ